MGFNPSVYEYTCMGSIQGINKATRAALIQSLSGQELYDMIAWIYLASTNQVFYSGDGRARIHLNRCEPIERDCIMNFILMVCPNNTKTRQVMSQFERQFS